MAVMIYIYTFRRSYLRITTTIALPISRYLHHMILRPILLFPGLLLRLRLLLFPAILALDAPPPLRRITEPLVAALALAARAQPAVRDAPAVLARAHGAVGEDVLLALLDAVLPVQAGVARHLHHTARREVDLYRLPLLPLSPFPILAPIFIFVYAIDLRLGPAELHDDGGPQRQREELVVGRVRVDVGRDAGAGGVVLQADLLRVPRRLLLVAREPRDQGPQPGREGLVGDGGVHAEGLVVEGVPVVQREARAGLLGLGPRELVPEDVQELGLVAGGYEVGLELQAPGECGAFFHCVLRERALRVVKWG